MDGFESPPSRLTHEASNQILSIQYLRAFAALLVVVYHVLAIKELSYLFRSDIGSAGVEIFFVISGFIMWHTTVNSKIGPITFLRHRLIRVIPLYWLSLTSMISICLFFPKAVNSAVITWEGVIKSFLFIPYFNAVAGNGIAPILVPGWSLNYEMFFYLLFGASIFVGPILLRFCLLSVVLIGLVIIGSVTQPEGAIAISYTNNAILKFLAGIIIAVFFDSLKLRGLTCSFILIPLGVSGYGSMGSHVLHSISPALIVAGTLSAEAMFRARPSSLFRLIGDASYSIYLSHLFLVRLMEMIWRHLQLFETTWFADAIFVTSSVCLAALIGLVVHLLIETPIIDRLRRLELRHLIEKLGY